MIADVISRLTDQVAALSGRVEGAAQFADLMRRNALPQVTPAAHVLPLGLQGGSAEAATGIFTQMTDKSVGIVLTIRSHDRTGAKALATVEELIDSVVTAIAGWTPGSTVGVFRLMRGQLVNMSAGTLVYQLDFAISDQLRIVT